MLGPTFSSFWNRKKCFSASWEPRFLGSIRKAAKQAFSLKWRTKWTPCTEENGGAERGWLWARAVNNHLWSTNQVSRSSGNDNSEWDHVTHIKMQHERFWKCKKRNHLPFMLSSESGYQLYLQSLYNLSSNIPNPSLHRHFTKLQG